MTDPVDSGGYTGNENGQQQGDPAWNEFLQAVPQELHSQVTPILEKWDRGVQDRFSKVHSEYEPWKPVIKSGLSPDEAQFAVNMVNALNQDPRMVYDAIREFYKLEDQAPKSGQGQQEPPQEEDPYAARFADIERQNQIMAQHLVRQREEELYKKAEAELNNELSSLAEKYKSRGEFDEQFVLAKMQNGMAGEDAVKAFFDWRDKYVNQYVPKPLIMGGGGGIPQQNVDVRKMSDQQAREYAAQIARSMAAQRNQ